MVPVSLGLADSVYGGGLEAVQSGAVTQSIWRWLTRPLNAWWIHAVALWGWHAPALFQATLTSDLVHSLQHLSFLLSALLFWWALLRGRDAQWGTGWRCSTFSATEFIAASLARY